HRSSWPTSRPRPARCSPTSATASRRCPTLARLLVVNLEAGLCRLRGEPAFDPRAHGRHERFVAEALPALLGLVNGDDHPAVGRRAGRVEDLPLGKASVAGMDGCDRRLVLLLRPARKVMHDSVGHQWLLSDRSKPCVATISRTAGTDESMVGWASVPD